MAKMKKLQPQMEQLRERYKDDKVRQQQELMELYKREKVNPIAGCLPILLQLPVFFALYKVLFITIDMRHAPFFGWIKDLSAPDPTTFFNLFGLLPFAVPEFLHIGVWPLIMGITMWLQMQLNPQQPDPVQQQIFSWMPVHLHLPAGLVPGRTGDLLGLEQHPVARAAVLHHEKAGRRDPPHRQPVAADEAAGVGLGTRVDGHTPAHAGVGRPQGRQREQGRKAAETAAKPKRKDTH